MTTQKPSLDAHLEFAKWMAIFTMVVDHAGYMFAAHVDYVAWRAVGRLCWPLIAWIVAMRLYAVPTRTAGYLKRLLPWAVIAQAPYAFIFSVNKSPVPMPWYDQFNILFTIALGCILFMLIELWGKAGTAKRVLLALAIVLVLCAGNKVDYGAVGVVSIPVMVLLARQSLTRAAIASGLLGCLANLLVLVEDGLLDKYWILALSSLPASAIAFMCLENYMPLWRLPRWFFYLFYPLHLVLLVILLVILYPPASP